MQTETHNRLHSCKVSLDYIAQELGLSKTTVSWVLSGKGDEKRISAVTQKTVMDFAEKYNYQPNYLARALNVGSTNTIGLVLSSLSDAFYFGVATSVVRQAERAGYTVMIATSESELEREDKVIASMRRKNVDGVIITPMQGAKGEVNKMIEDSFPCVVVDRHFDDLKTDYVVIDNEKSSYLLVKHLIDKGSRRIAFFTTSAHLTNMKDRYRGYRRAHEEAGLVIDPKLYCEVPVLNEDTATRDELNRLLVEAPDVDGFFFATHILALSAYICLMERGYDIGGGKNWACIHSLPEFRAMVPEMSIAQMPVDEIGKCAVDILLKHLDKKAGLPAGKSEVRLECGLKLI